MNNTQELINITARLNERARLHAVSYEAFGDDSDLALHDESKELARRINVVVEILQKDEEIELATGESK